MSYTTPELYRNLLAKLNQVGFKHIGHVNDPGWVKPEGKFDEHYYDGIGNNIWIDRETKQYYEMDSSD